MRICPILREHIVWPFDGKPCVKISPQHTYARSIEVDPFPAYAHDAERVRREAERVHRAFPIEYETTFYILPYELPSRTNAHASLDRIYKDCECGACVKERAGKPASNKEWFEPYVVLQAKRIPPHPAMTRYLVAHEYGHIVQYWIEHKRGIKDAVTTDLDREYMKLRPGSTNDYGGGKWHQNVGELFANDFRILVCESEMEFWPHPGFPHPQECKAVQEFWRSAVDQFKWNPEPGNA